MTKIWLGHKPLKYRYDTDGCEGLSYVSGKYKYIVFKGVGFGYVAILDNTKEKTFLTFAVEKYNVRVFAKICSDEEANAMIDYFNEHKIEIVDGLAHDPNHKYI
jgi:hypothetical protein